MGKLVISGLLVAAASYELDLCFLPQLKAARSYNHLNNGSRVSFISFLTATPVLLSNLHPVPSISSSHPVLFLRPLHRPHPRIPLPLTIMHGSNAVTTQDSRSTFQVRSAVRWQVIQTLGFSHFLMGKRCW